MKKVGELMQELGFRPEASEAVAKAFIKNLVREANIQDIELEKNKKEKPLKKDLSKNPNEQLSLFSHIKKVGS